MNSKIALMPSVICVLKSTSEGEENGEREKQGTVNNITKADSNSEPKASQNKP